MAELILNSTKQLTKDNSNNRDNYQPNIVRLDNGRMFMVYAKKLNTGKNAIIRMTYSGLTLTVPAGTGLLNEVSTTWIQTNLTIPASSYCLIYVDSTNTVKYLQARDNTIGGMDIESLNNKIILGYVNSGSTIITYVENTELKSNYLYCQKQELVNGIYEWVGIEYRLNSGERPYTRYDSVTKKIHITYLRDGSTWHRIVDPNDSLTLEYVPNVRLVTNQLTPDSNFERTSSVSCGSSNMACVAVMLTNIFQTSSPFFRQEYKRYQDYIDMVNINFSNKPYINSSLLITQQPMDKSVLNGQEVYFKTDIQTNNVSSGVLQNGTLRFLTYPTENSKSVLSTDGYSLNYSVTGGKEGLNGFFTNNLEGWITVEGTPYTITDYRGCAFVGKLLECGTRPTINRTKVKRTITGIVGNSVYSYQFHATCHPSETDHVDGTVIFYDNSNTVVGTFNTSKSSPGKWPSYSTYSVLALAPSNATYAEIYLTAYYVGNDPTNIDIVFGEVIFRYLGIMMINTTLTVSRGENKQSAFTTSEWSGSVSTSLNGNYLRFTGSYVCSVITSVNFKTNYKIFGKMKMTVLTLNPMTIGLCSSENSGNGYELSFSINNSTSTCSVGMYRPGVGYATPGVVDTTTTIAQGNIIEYSCEVVNNIMISFTYNIYSSDGVTLLKSKTSNPMFDVNTNNIYVKPNIVGYPGNTFDVVYLEYQYLSDETNSPTVYSGDIGNCDNGYYITNQTLSLSNMTLTKGGQTPSSDSYTLVGNTLTHTVVGGWGSINTPTITGLINGEFRVKQTQNGTIDLYLFKSTNNQFVAGTRLHLPYNQAQFGNSPTSPTDNVNYVSYTIDQNVFYKVRIYFVDSFVITEFLTDSGTLIDYRCSTYTPDTNNQYYISFGSEVAGTTTFEVIKLETTKIKSSSTYYYNLYKSYQLVHSIKTNDSFSYPIDSPAKSGDYILKVNDSSGSVIWSNKIDVTVDGTFNGVSFQWYRNNNLMLNETNKVLRIIPDQTFNNDKFYCRVNNIENTRTATLTIYDWNYYINLPYLYSQFSGYIDYIYSTIIMTIYDSLDNPLLNYTITKTQDLFTFIPFINNLQTGKYKLGVDIFKHGLDNTPYQTPINERLQFYIYKGEINWFDNERKMIIQSPTEIGNLGSSNINNSKTFEFYQVNTPTYEDSTTVGSIGAINTFNNKTFEFYQVNTPIYEDSTILGSIGSCGMSILKTYEV